MISTLARSIMPFLILQAFYISTYTKYVSALVDKRIYPEWFFFVVGQIIILATVILDVSRNGKGWKIYFSGAAALALSIWLARTQI
jgi:hypothetical protein